LTVRKAITSICTWYVPGYGWIHAVDYERAAPAMYGKLQSPEIFDILLTKLHSAIHQRLERKIKVSS
jgi:hypothetical protein